MKRLMHAISFGAIFFLSSINGFSQVDASESGSDKIKSETAVIATITQAVIQYHAGLSKVSTSVLEAIDRYEKMEGAGLTVEQYTILKQKTQRDLANFTIATFNNKTFKNFIEINDGTKKAILDAASEFTVKYKSEQLSAVLAAYFKYHALVTQVNVPNPSEWSGLSDMDYKNDLLIQKEKDFLTLLNDHTNTAFVDIIKLLADYPDSLLDPKFAEYKAGLKQMLQDLAKKGVKTG